jgi:mono/diheme cytochrome c family protein
MAEQTAERRIRLMPCDAALRTQASQRTWLVLFTLFWLRSSACDRLALDSVCAGLEGQLGIKDLIDQTMSSFSEAPEGESAKGAKIFKTKCSQCHVPEKGGGHKQARVSTLA